MLGRRDLEIVLLRARPSLTLQNLKIKSNLGDFRVNMLNKTNLLLLRVMGLQNTYQNT